MGAWGHGHFENDAALDFVVDVEGSSNPKKLFTEVFDNAIAADYLDSDEGCAVIVAAAYVDNHLNGTTFSIANNDEPLQVDTFGSRNTSINLLDIKTRAVAALEKVLAEDSELLELWMENEEDYPLWRSSVDQLMARLKR